MTEDVILARTKLRINLHDLYLTKCLYVATCERNYVYKILLRLRSCNQASESQLIVMALIPKINRSKMRPNSNLLFWFRGKNK